MRREVARARRDPSLDEANAARLRLARTAEVLAGADADADGPSVLARFDEEIGAPDDALASAALLEVVPIAIRFDGGWLLSVEHWSDHWRAVVVAEPEELVEDGWWTAVDPTDGRRFASCPLDAEVLRFAPALAPDWSVLVFERHGAGEVLEVEVHR